MTGKKGGEFIASGTYGCVFAPPIKCNRKPSKLPKENVVGKVYSDDEEIKEERKSYEIMKKIDPKGKFSLPFYGVCKLNIKNAVLSDKIDKCGHIESFKKDYQQLLSEFGGLELKNAMKTVELYDLIPAFYELFKGLDVMIKAGYCHKDIKGPNILYNLDTKKIVFADYGMLMKIKDLPKTASRDAYMWWPPEMFFLYIRKYMSLRANFPYDYMTACHHLLSGFNWFGVANIENVYPDFVNDLTSYAKLCFTKPYSELLNEYNDNKYGEKFDIYSLCMTFIECYVKYTSITFKNKVIIKKFITEVIVQGLNPNPEKRINIKDLLILYKQFMMDNNIEFNNKLVTPPTIHHKDKSVSNKNPLDNCMLSEAKGGYKITELRAIAKSLGITAMKRKDICTEMIAKNLYKHKTR